MFDRRHCGLLIGAVFVAAPIMSSTSSITAGSEPAGRAASSLDSTTPQDAAQDITFQLRWSERSVGRVVAVRTLERRDLDTLESRMEWSIGIEPNQEGNGWRIASGPPTVSPLRARLPEDALNQLLVGRMFLASGVLDREGAFQAAAGTAASVKALHESLCNASASLFKPPAPTRFLQNALPERVVETTTREHWKRMIQSFMGRTMRVGATYESESPSELPGGQSVVFVSKFTVVAQKPYVPNRSAPSCVQIEGHSRPKESLLDVIQDSAAAMLAGAKFERFDMAVDMVQVVDPSTLTPYSLKMVRKTEASVRLPNGAPIPTREVSTEQWQYLWDLDESKKGG